MNPGLDETRLRELAWRRPLTAEELARLANCLREHPDRRAEWQADLALAAVLRQLPERPAPSNLTARILAEVDRLESAKTSRPATTPIGWPRWLRWSLGASMAVVLLGGGLHWRQQQQQAAALVKLAKATEASAVPSMDALQNFDVILKIHPEAQADLQLLALSQQLAEFNAKR
jgi:hypothetical protein